MSIPGSANPLLLATAAAAADDAVTIERSLRFNDDDSAYLTFTPSSSGNLTTWTWSGWVKRSDLTGAEQMLITAGNDSNNVDLFYFDTDDTLKYLGLSGGSIIINFETNAKFVDCSAWYHIVAARSGSTFNVYVNGVSQSFQTSTGSTSNGFFNKASTNQAIAARVDNSFSNEFDGYLAELHFVDGSALAATDFGEYDSNEVWQPKAYTGSHGTNGWHLNFSDATSTSTISEDQSSNGNDWTANNISVTAGNGNDSVFDSPQAGTQTDSGAGGEVSGNYCTLDYYGKDTEVSYENGNLLAENTTQATRGCFGTFPITSGKWYWEVYMHRASSTDLVQVGLLESDYDTAIPTARSDFQDVLAYTEGGLFKNDGSSSSYGATFATGDTIGVAFDADNGSLTFYKNGTSQGVATSSISSSKYPYVPIFRMYDAKIEVNFGAKAFTHSAPSGYKCLCSANLADPAIAKGSDHFDVVTYTGSGASKSITGLNFSPDLVIISNRGTTDKSVVTDSVRGATKELVWDPTEEAESTNADGLTSFDSDGFTVGADVLYNRSSDSYVAWTWNAGSGSASSNSDGSETTTVKANTTAGLSIMSFTGTGATDTFGHGLNNIPECYIVRRTDDPRYFKFYTTAIDDSLDILAFNQQGSKGDITTTKPTSSVITLTGSTTHNNNNSPSIVYLMAPIEGFSKFGVYSGRGTNTTFLYENFVNCGFRPKFVLIREYFDSTNHGYIFDSSRNPVNAVDQVLRSTTNTAEIDIGDIYFLSNGFKIVSTSNSYNQNAQEYLYMAFAEHPWKNARAF